MAQHSRTRLSSWRQVADGIEHLPKYRQASGGTDALLQAHQRRLQTMCLTTLKEYEAFYTALLAFARQAGRDSQLAQRITDMCTYALRQYEQSSTLLLRMGIEQEIKRFLQEVGSTSLPPPPLP